MVISIHKAPLSLAASTTHSPEIEGTHPFSASNTRALKEQKAVGGSSSSEVCVFVRALERMADGSKRQHKPSLATGSGWKRILNLPQGSLKGNVLPLVIFGFYLMTEHVGGNGMFLCIENVPRRKHRSTAFSPPLFFTQGRKPDVCSKSSIESSARAVLQGVGGRAAPKVACNAKLEGELKFARYAMPRTEPVFGGRCGGVGQNH